MKKLLALIVLATIGFTSCKKEELAKPTVKDKTVSNLKDIGTWD